MVKRRCRAPGGSGCAPPPRRRRWRRRRGGDDDGEEARVRRARDPVLPLARPLAAPGARRRRWRRGPAGPGRLRVHAAAAAAAAADATRWRRRQRRVPAGSARGTAGEEAWAHRARGQVRPRSATGRLRVRAITAAAAATTAPGARRRRGRRGLAGHRPSVPEEIICSSNSCMQSLGIRTKGQIPRHCVHRRHAIITQVFVSIGLSWFHLLQKRHLRAMIFLWTLECFRLHIK